MDIPDEHVIMILVDFQQCIFLPGILSVTDTGTEDLGEADFVVFSKTLRRLFGIKCADKPAPVIRIDIFLSIFPYKLPDTQPGGKQVFLRVCIQRFYPVF